jgi:hypothetical protein
VVVNNFITVRKRLFVGLLGVSVLGAVALLAGIWFLAVNPSRTFFDQALLLALAGLLIGGVAIAAFGIGGIVLTILYSKDITAFHGPMRVAVNLFFPLVLVIGKIFHIDSDKIKSSFVEVNNDLVRSRALKLKPAQILLLVPHCLQNTDCPHKITIKIDNCRRCGDCPVKELLALKDFYGINIGMAAGGTLARKYVQEYRPRAIVAIACERDLTSGILDTNPIPVLGVTNERPCGPCFNTLVKIQEVEEAIRFFISEEEYKMAVYSH